MSKALTGTVVSEGLARGEALVVATGQVYVPEGRVADHLVEREVQRFRRAVEDTRVDIENLAEATKARLGDMADIIRTYLAFLSDEAGILRPIETLIRGEKYTATFATFRHFMGVAKELERMPEPLPSRVPDLMDIKGRIISHLRGGRYGRGALEKLRRKVVIIADDLTPTQTAGLDRDKVLAFATDRGGPASHTAILARHLGIPAVVGLDSVTRLARSGQSVIVDGYTGRVTVDPDEEEVRGFVVRLRNLTARRRKVRAEASGPVRTRDGTPITILGNIDRGAQGQELVGLGAQGVGLFRTEYLFLGRASPDENEQCQEYEQLLRTMAPHPVSIRTMDFGADKWDHRVGGTAEPNPFLGMRAIRLSFAHEPLFRTQLRAILRASVVGRCDLMFPMISDVEEMRRARGILNSVRNELEQEGIPFRSDMRVGAMVELPSAALTVRNLLKEADFLSLGTNDLTQYTLAVDRTNPLVASLFTPHHPAVLRLMRTAIDGAREAGKPISACGEMAGTPGYTPVVLGLGLQRLSMAASRIPDVVEQIRRLDALACRGLVDEMIASDGASASLGLLRGFQESLSRRGGPRAV